jgi:hypothetical protein
MKIFIKSKNVYFPKVRILTILIEISMNYAFIVSQISSQNVTLILIQNSVKIDQYVT